MFSPSVRAKCIFALACCLISTGSIADSSSSSVVKFLPDDALPQEVLSAFLEARHVGDYRVVEVDTDALRQMIREAYPPSTVAGLPRISLPLIDMSLVEIGLRGGGEEHAGWQTGIATFLGRVTEDEYSSVTCVVAPDGSVNLTIRTAGKRYKLEKTSLLPYHVYWSLGEGFSRKID